MIKRTNYIPDGKHLTLNDRQSIQDGIEKRLTIRHIAKFIGKDETTVAKEIIRHRKFKSRNTFNRPSICIHLKACKGCKKRCEKYQEEVCIMRDRSPKACNKCERITKCSLDKYFYIATEADQNYRRDLVDFREGINLTTKERDEIANIIVPLIKNGQSIYQILLSHPEIKQCEKTIYNYIDMGVFHDFGIQNISLKEKTKRKQFKNKYKKRREQMDFTGRTYTDYQNFILENPNIKTVEMDIVSNSPSGPFIQTFMFVEPKLMIGFIHKEKTAQSMANAINIIEERLGHYVFRKLFPVALTDRGNEFLNHKLIEHSINGEKRLQLFYCDPMQSYQKPHVENNHNYVRDIIPNKLDITSLTQCKVDLMFSHINSTPREVLNGKTPYELFKFYYGVDILNALMVEDIKRDDVVLAPHLLK